MKRLLEVRALHLVSTAMSSLKQRLIGQSPHINMDTEMPCSAIESYGNANYMTLSQGSAVTAEFATCNYHYGRCHPSSVFSSDYLTVVRALSDS